VEKRKNMAAGTGVAGPGSSCSPSTDIPPENIKEEDESRRGEAGLADAWDKYRQFEAYRYSSLPYDFQYRSLFTFCSAYRIFI
jgi:hypothetical protein